MLCYVILKPLLYTMTPNLSFYLLRMPHIVPVCQADIILLHIKTRSSSLAQCWVLPAGSASCIRRQ